MKDSAVNVSKTGRDRLSFSITTSVIGIGAQIKNTKAMATVIYEIPNSVKEMFEQGENSYRIIDYSIQEMDNIQSMQHFLDCIGATSDNIETDDGTQVVIIHPDFDHKLVIDSGGLGDFYSHGYDVTLYSETVSSTCA